VIEVADEDAFLVLHSGSDGAEVVVQYAGAGRSGERAGACVDVEFVGNADAWELGRVGEGSGQRGSAARRDLECPDAGPDTVGVDRAAVVRSEVPGDAVGEREGLVEVMIEDGAECGVQLEVLDAAVPSLKVPSREGGCGRGRCRYGRRDRGTPRFDATGRGRSADRTRDAAAQHRYREQRAAQQPDSRSFPQGSALRSKNAERSVRSSRPLCVRDGSLCLRDGVAGWEDLDPGPAGSKTDSVPVRIGEGFGLPIGRA